MAFALRISQGAGAFPHGVLTRRELERQIEERIALLDLIDGDPDLEPDLGWSGTTYSIGSADDREDDAGDDCEMDDDREWSLGRCEHINQAIVHHGEPGDLEASL